ncbi:hypothetical protein ACVWW6_001172 [Bradyrhizobium sp. USDA 3311]
MAIATSPRMKEPPQRGGQRHRDDLRPPQRIERLLGDDQAAGRHQDLLQMLAVDRQDQHALDDQAERAGHRHRQQRSRRQHREVHPERIGLNGRRKRCQHQGCDIGADGDEGAMTEIEHVHQAEHQRQPGGHDEDHHAHGEARGGQRQPGAGRADQRDHQEGERDRQQDRRDVALRLRQRIVCGKFCH